MEPKVPRVAIEVLAKGQGATVVRLAGYRMPLLLLHPDALADLKRVTEAAALRARNGDSGLADAIQDFLKRLNVVTSEFDSEAQKFSEYMDARGKADADDALREFDAEMLVLKQLGPNDAGT
jgi:hypothetical protein